MSADAQRTPQPSHPQSQAQDHANDAVRSPGTGVGIAPVESGDSNTSDGSTRPASGNGAGNFFVTPASYLKPLGRPQGAGAKAGAPGMGDEMGIGSLGSSMKRGSLGLVEREQVEGLVSRYIDGGVDCADDMVVESHKSVP